MKNYFIISCITAVSMIACQNEDTALLENSELNTKTEDMKRQGQNSFEAYPQQKGILKKAFLNGEEISYEEINNELVYQGDIILNPDMLSTVKGNSTERTGIRGEQYRWKNKRVYYSINPDLPAKQRVIDAIAHVEANTDIRFIERTTQTNYIYFNKGQGCSSYIGKQGGKQNITLNITCSTGAAIHEIGHALGLFHEQSRLDRNDFLTIKWNNIEDGYQHNFKTWQTLGYNGFDLGDNLDFNSIMLYGPYSFSKNGRPTITKKDGSLYNSNYSQLSQGDITTIAFMYRNE
jgi:hypothetical protein